MTTQICTRRLTCSLWGQRKANFATHNKLLVGGSGRFRKMNQATPQFLQRIGEKQETAFTNTVLDPDYLDSMVPSDYILYYNSQVKTMLKEPGSGISFLKKRSVPNMAEEDQGVRDNIARDWNHITETVVSLGVPELADAVGGQMFAGANSMTTSTTNQAYHLADHIAGFTDKELQHIITVIAGWPGDSGGSESLSKILHGLDYAAAGRCPSWEEGVRLKLALIWATFAFRPVHVQFCRSTLELASPSLGSFSLKHLMQYLLLVSYRAEDKVIKSVLKT